MIFWVNIDEDRITKLYIEPTAHCNLSCPMCSRNYWVDEKMGHMDYSLFEKAISEAKQTESIQTVFFGGIASLWCSRASSI